MKHVKHIPHYKEDRAYKSTIMLIDECYGLIHNKKRVGSDTKKPFLCKFQIETGDKNLFKITSFWQLK